MFCGAIKGFGKRHYIVIRTEDNSMDAYPAANKIIYCFLRHLFSEYPGLHWIY